MSRPNRRIDPDILGDLKGRMRLFWDQEVATTVEVMGLPNPSVDDPNYMLKQRDLATLKTARIRLMRELAQACSGEIHPKGHNEKPEKDETRDFMAALSKRIAKGEG
jgi:hypothetical protein